MLITVSMQGCPKTETPRRVGQLRLLYIILDQGEAGRGLDSKGKAGSSWADKREQARGQQILAGPPRNNGTQKGGQQTGLAGFLPV